MLLHSFATPSNSDSRQIVFPKYRQSNTIWPNKNQIFTFGRWGCCKVGMAEREWAMAFEALGCVRGRAVKTYQSQVIPTAVQRCDHHLLINNPYWEEETDKEDCVNALSFPLSGVTWKMIYWTVHLTSQLVSPTAAHHVFFFKLKTSFHDVNEQLKTSFKEPSHLI